MEGKYKLALNSFNNRIFTNHPSRPFAHHLKAATYSILKRYEAADAEFRECYYQSNKYFKRYKSKNRKRNLLINKDLCLVGISRNQFAKKKFSDANLSYLDLSKSSYIWPEIMFEEAWNSFYLKDYNRSLGKLVTYKAPVFDYIFNPEVNILRSLAYMELCLWDDVNKVVENFYKKYSSGNDYIKNILAKNKNRYIAYYKLGKKALNRDRLIRNKLLRTILKGISRDPAFLELFDSFHSAKKEISTLKKMRGIRGKSVLMDSLREALVLQRNLIGFYVKNSLMKHSKRLDKAFEGMSYIKLEILSSQKDRIYGIKINNKRERGDIKNLKRNEKQYFWRFNGEFWADELGDYVFSLKSQC